MQEGWIESSDVIALVFDCALGFVAKVIFQRWCVGVRLWCGVAPGVVRLSRTTSG